MRRTQNRDISEQVTRGAVDAVWYLLGIVALSLIGVAVFVFIYAQTV